MLQCPGAVKVHVWPFPGHPPNGTPARPSCAAINPWDPVRELKRKDKDGQDDIGTIRDVLEEAGMDSLISLVDAMQREDELFELKNGFPHSSM